MELRKAVADDIAEIVKIYDKVLDNEESGKSSVGWKRGIYPTRDTAAGALERSDLFVMTEGEEVVAAAIINQIQGVDYAFAKWHYAAPAEEVMVLHTLVVDPERGGHGYGTAFVKFYEEYARENHCLYLRMDTNALNTPARRLYNHLGYEECDIVPCSFNGIDGVNLVCLEKVLK